MKEKNHRQRKSDATPPQTQCAITAAVNDCYAARVSRGVLTLTADSVEGAG